MDLDDLQFTLNTGRVADLSLAYLFYLKTLFPKFRVTIFAIPNRCPKHILQEVNKLDWIQLAVHGWQHDSNYEAFEWTKEQCLEVLGQVEKDFENIFVKGFKAPGWQISAGCYEALLEEGYWVADHVYNEDRRPKELPAYKLDHPWCIHGHTWDIQGVARDQQNGIRQLIEERGLIEKLTQDTNFHFISDVIREQTAENIRLASGQHLRDTAGEARLHREELGNNVSAQRGLYVSGYRRRPEPFGDIRENQGQGAPLHPPVSESGVRQGDEYRDKPFYQPLHNPAE